MIPEARYFGSLWSHRDWRTMLNWVLAVALALSMVVLLKHLQCHASLRVNCHIPRPISS